MEASEAKRTAVARTQRGARYGSGTLVKRAGPNGDTWIAKWRDGGRQVQRGLGFVHSKKRPGGLTRAEAEAALGKLREQVGIERAAAREADAKRALEDRRRTRPLSDVSRDPVLLPELADRAVLVARGAVLLALRSSPITRVRGSRPDGAERLDVLALGGHAHHLIHFDKSFKSVIGSMAARLDQPREAGRAVPHPSVA
jgi:multidrug efflux pump subunit AcrA (membrane-fusion protein)